MWRSGGSVQFLASLVIVKVDTKVDIHGPNEACDPTGNRPHELGLIHESDHIFEHILLSFIPLIFTEAYLNDGHFPRQARS